MAKERKNWAKSTWVAPEMEFLELFRALVSRYLFPDPPASASSRSLPRIPLDSLEIEKSWITLVTSVKCLERGLYSSQQWRLN